ncbi:MAG: Hsp70 family protein [Victivallales bacterium]|nr:Hsp70 family protein [Victivallales bacterium]MCF7889230.1 Hsp70 family protein [Victivallales bacterium]
MSRYLIGIDLGTTNSVVYYLDNNKTEDMKPQLLEIPQLIEFGETDIKPALPSFLYWPDEKEIPENGLALPWESEERFAVGDMAKKRSSSSPLKTVSSAKSWLCVDNIDRLSPVLPWQRDNKEKKMSPVEASKQLLIYIKNVWNSKIASDSEELRIENQTVILTVPASFDAVARELTAKAAEEAGLNVRLLEEPQAAIYSWLLENGENWRKQVSTDDVILVCDIGGGTTDLCLIKVNNEKGNLRLERIAVGNHILLGGDNMDLTAAYTAAAKLKQEKNIKIDSYQIAGLTHACRQAKEKLLSEKEDFKVQKLTVLGKGSSLIANTVSTEITKNELTKILMEGFFPVCELTDKPKRGTKAGFKSFGLNYEADPAVTKHIAEFLTLHTGNDNDKLPNCVLFNGGVTKADKIRDRIVEILTEWLPEGRKSVKVLTGNNPDRAVSAGAVYYANVKEGKGIRIKAGSSHAYYLGIESSMPAVPGFTPPVQGICVLPIGTEEGASLDIDYSGIGLVVGEKTEFKCYSSVLRKDDKAGEIIEDINTVEGIEEMTPVTAELPSSDEISPGSLVPVKLRCELTEIGTMQIWCKSLNTDNEWKLNFELRNH